MTVSLSYAVTLIEAYCNSGLPDGICETFHSHLFSWTILIEFDIGIAHNRRWCRDIKWASIFFILESGISIELTRVIPALGPGKTIGRHIWEVRIKDLNKSYFQVRDFDADEYDATAKIDCDSQSLLAAVDLYCMSAFLVKLSLFLLYLRLFKPDKITRWLIYVGTLVCGLFYSATLIIYSALSTPSRGQPDTDTSWLLRTIKYKYGFQTLMTILGAFGVFSDSYLLVIPIRSIFQLHLPLRRKFGVNSIFLIGILWVMISDSQYWFGCAKSFEYSAISCSIAALFYRLKSFYVDDYTWFTPLLYIST